MDQTYLAGVMKKVLGRNVAGVQAVPLPGDASNRLYFRLKVRSRGRTASLILMKLAAPEPFKQSEEKVTRSTISATELPFINVLRHLQASEVHVQIGRAHV